MTLGEKVKQCLTGRPDSHVPGRAACRDAPRRHADVGALPRDMTGLASGPDG